MQTNYQTISALIAHTGAGYIAVISPDHIYSELRFPSGRIIRSVSADEPTAVEELISYTKYHGLYQTDSILRTDLPYLWDEGQWPTSLTSR